jgi:D-arabinose 1-dehydrogenase-like Zn-dependent alcohol dehydrogenase
MTKMRAVLMGHAKASLNVVEMDVPEPGPGMVRIKVQACGVCHSDSLTVEGGFSAGHLPTRARP